MKYCNPYDSLKDGQWLKTNFHTHAGTGEGCGKHPLDMVLGLYRELKYGALCISNHDFCTDVSSLSDEQLYVMPGVEYSRDRHMLTVGVNKSFHELSHQDAIDATIKQGGFTIICHPNWIVKEYWPHKNLEELQGFAGIEVMNTLIYRLYGSGRATDTWDYLLSHGKLIFGFGDDDFHAPFDAGRSYTDIYAKTKDFAGIKDAVDNGRFTASTGLSLEYLDVTADNTIIVKAKFPTHTYINTFSYKFITENGEAAESYGETGVYKANGENYIRVEAIAENGAMLFTQPVYKKGAFA